MTSLDTIKHLYFNATKSTIQRDIDRAIDLLKAMQTDEERQSAAVYMDGLSQMRSEWGVRPGQSGGKGGGQPGSQRGDKTGGQKGKPSGPRRKP